MCVPAGKFGASASLTACTNCTGDSNSPAASSDQAACTCNIGYTGNAGTGACSACAKGKYKAAPGNATCTDCNLGKYNTDTGKTAAGDCTNCAAGKFGASAGMCSVCPCVQNALQ
jgi:hypothetical protein